MEYSGLSSNKRSLCSWVNFAAGGLLAVALAGCGGGGGSSDTTAAAPVGGGAPIVPTTSIVAAAALPANDTATNPNAAFAVVQNSGVPVVSVNSPPKIRFMVASDGTHMESLTASNVSVILAKLVPGTSGEPDQWVSYTSKTETATATVGPGSKPVLATAKQATTDPKQTDAALLAAQLVYNEPGYYTYTFSTDIKDPAKTNGVVYEPTRTHRVALQLSYKNKAGQTVVANPYFDFTIDANGNAVPVTDSSKTRKVVDITSCNECHGKLAMHGGGRVDTQYCVLCHNSGTTDANSGNNLDLRTMVHKIHAGKELKAKFSEDYTIWGYKDGANSYAEVGFPQELNNCVKCHDGSKKDAAGKQLAAQGDNWKNVPSRAACGSCHAGIDFAKGTGTTMSGATTGHVGGAKADDSKCALCHDATTIPEYHKGTVATPHNPVAKDGVAGISYEITSVTLNATKQPVIAFKIIKDGAALTSLAVPTLVRNAASGAMVVDPNYEPIPGFAGGPSFYLAYAVPQDGITAPADFNAYSSVALANLLIDAGSPKAGTLTSDGAGNFTATLTGDLIGQPVGAGCTKPTAPAVATCVNTAVSASPIAIPATAKMITGAMIGTFTQKNLAAYPYTAANVSVNPTTSASGGLIIKSVLKKVEASGITGNTGRRVIVDTAKCNACHDQLGTSPEFHGGARNDATACAICHDPNRTSSGWSADSTSFIHGIHGASKRTVPYTWHAVSATDNYSMLGYPGILKNCETCHLAGTYDFSAAASASAVPNRLYRAAATGTFDPAKNTTKSYSPYITADNVKNYGAGFKFDIVAGTTTAAAGTNLVHSPIAAACFSCHDSAAAQSHMGNDGGGSIYRDRATALTRTETCLFCHGAGKIVDIKAMHDK